MATNNGGSSSLADNAILEIRDLHTYFYTDLGISRALNGVSLSVPAGGVMGVVGESGCGKSVTALSVLRLVPKPGRIVQGEILFRRGRATPNTPISEAVDLTSLDPHGPDIRAIRGGEIAMIFQEPMTSLNPSYTVGDQIMEAVQLHQSFTREEALERTVDILRRVGMPNPAQTVERYPHELSGGMRQRAMIAMALSCTPDLLIADEPTTALDVTIQAEILDLMRELQEEIGMTIIFITHNLGVVAQMCDRVAVMYLGRVVEEADVEELFYKPQHPYTQALMRSIPRIGGQRKERLQPIRGVVPDPYAEIQGCAFHPRCDHAIPGKCDVRVPGLTQIDDGHQVRCFLYSEREEIDRGG